MRRRNITLVLLALVAAHAHALVAQQPVIAFEGVTVLPMTDTTRLLDQTVVVRGGRIVALGARGSVVVPPEAERVAAQGRFLLPGLVDAHVHLFDVRDLDLYLAHGVTSILNMSGAPMHLALRDKIRQGALSGPTLYTTGPQLKLEANLALDFERGVATVDEARRHVESTLRQGYDFVKVWGAFPPATYAAIATATRERGGRLTGHVPIAVGLGGVLEAGQGSIAHIEEFFNKIFRRRVDDAGLHEALAPIIQAPIPVITTLVTYQIIAASLAPDSSLLLARPGRALLDPVRQLLWQPGFNRYRQADRIGQDGFYREALAFEGRIAAALQQAGVPLVLGTDAGEIPGLVPGLEVHRELEQLVASGLSPFQALQTATRNAGAFLGSTDDRFGTVTVGSRADLLLLESDPTATIGHSRRIVGVMARGAWYPRADLAQRLERLRDGNDRTASVVTAILQGGGSAGREAAERLHAETSAVTPFAEAPLVLLAFALAERGDLPNAVGVLRLLTETYPESYMSFYILGAALLQGGQVDAARAALSRVLQLVPEHDAAARLYGTIP